MPGEEMPIAESRGNSRMDESNPNTKGQIYRLDLNTTPVQCLLLETGQPKQALHPPA
jgi:hypothetical protein